MPSSLPSAASLAAEFGVHVVRPSEAQPAIQRRTIGGGRLWHSTGAIGRIMRDPEPVSPYGVAVLALLEGQAQFEFAGRSCVLEAGGVTFLYDGLRSAIEADHAVGLVSIELPHAVSARIDGKRLAARSALDVPTTRLLHESVRTLWASVGHLNSVQGAAALGAVASLARVAASPLLQSSSGATLLVELAMERIEQDLADPDLNAARIAESCKVSRRYLDGLFRREMNATIDQWLRERRLVRANDLLEAGGRAEIGVFGVALECGFTSAAHFSRAFRARFGHPPRVSKT